MDERLDIIYRRRSVRAYQDKEIEDSVVREILEAAMAAPSAVAKDPWHFIVVRNSETLKRTAEALPYGKMLGDAPLGIIVCGDIHQAHDEQESYLLQDCAAAIENLLVGAAALRVGSCWLGVHPRQERIDHVRAVFELPTHIIPVSAIALGYPDETASPRTRYREEAVHTENW